MCGQNFKRHLATLLVNTDLTNGLILYLTSHGKMRDESDKAVGLGQTSVCYSCGSVEAMQVNATLILNWSIVERRSLV